MDATIQRLVREDFDAYASERRLPRHVHRAARAMVACRTARLGGHVERCPHGHVERVWYNSCRDRSCPQCGWTGVERWLERQRSRVLECEHFHVVFTVPHELLVLWRRNRRLMVEALFRCAWETLRELLGDERYLGARPGVIATLHTWGRTLTVHPHLHCLVTGGGLDAAGEWRAVSNGFLLPARVVCALFRGKYLAALRAAWNAGRLALPEGMAECELERLLNRLGRKKWSVRVKERYPDANAVVLYLGRYVRGGPISNRRIVRLDSEGVIFRYTDHRDGKSKTMRLRRRDFLARLLWHVPEPRQHNVRYYGLYRGQLRDLRARCRAELHQAPERAPPAPLGAIELLRSRGIRRETRCPKCGAPLVTAATLPRQRGPP